VLTLEWSYRNVDISKLSQWTPELRYIKNSQILSAVCVGVYLLLYYLPALGYSASR